jgi:DNA polymerase-4
MLESLIQTLAISALPVIFAITLHEAAHGIDERPIVTESEPKSISRESTFQRDLHPRQDRDELSEAFTGICLRVADDLARKGYVARTIGIKLRYADFRSVTRDITLRHGVSDGARIRQAAGECLKRVPLAKKIRLLGVRASGLIPVGEVDREPASAQAELPF